MNLINHAFSFGKVSLLESSAGPGDMGRGNRHWLVGTSVPTRMDGSLSCAAGALSISNPYGGKRHTRRAPRRSEPRARAASAPKATPCAVDAVRAVDVPGP